MPSTSERQAWWGYAAVKASANASAIFWCPRVSGWTPSSFADSPRTGEHKAQIRGLS